MLLCASTRTLEFGHKQLFLIIINKHFSCAIPADGDHLDDYDNYNNINIDVDDDNDNDNDVYDSDNEDDDCGVSWLYGHQSKKGGFIIQGQSSFFGWKLFATNLRDGRSLG